MNAEQIEADIWKLDSFESGNDRLSIHIVGGGEYDVGLDFHELIWEKLENNKWVRVKTINSAHLRNKNGERGWLLEIHSFDPVKETATVRAGEGDNTPVYSWSLLDLKNRCLVKSYRSAQLHLNHISANKAHHCGRQTAHFVRAYWRPCA